MNAQNSRPSSAESFFLIQKMPFWHLSTVYCELLVHLWLLGPFFWGHKFTPISYTHNQTLLFNITNWTHCLMFLMIIMCRGWWFPHSSDFNMCFHLWGMLQEVKSSNHQTEDKNEKKHLGSTVLNFTSRISMYNNVFVQCDAWLEGEGHYCQLFKCE